MTLLNKYRPKLCKIRSWNEIEQDFNECFGEQYRTTIAELVRHINTSGLADRLFGVMSMDKLVIGIYDPVEWDRETLHVTFDTRKKEWHFVYHAMPFRPPEFVRTYPVEKGIGKFDNFVQIIGW